GELDALDKALSDGFDRLKVGGRMAVITFHSLEDRIVKTNFKRNENPCVCPPGFPVCVCGRRPKGRQLTKKPILPTEQEKEINPRSKSAKLRVFEKRPAETT
ncbi:MAG: 16S rRNA (cytosine(1402)-N(4))-methyltransferase, partial [Lachnospiraceae bacterium]|nr:16S rRNA (cytosine(1402)-N(4))-methyltransferase [Lachnospiraceae bacterium]